MTDPLVADGAAGLSTTHSLILATELVAMRPPYVVVRSHTKPDSRAARRTTLVVIAVLGLRYVLPRSTARSVASTPQGSAQPVRSDVLVLERPGLILGGPPAPLLTGLLTARAFAAFLSASSEFVVAVPVDVPDGHAPCRLGAG